MRSFSESREIFGMILWIRSYRRFALYVRSGSSHPAEVSRVRTGSMDWRMDRYAVIISFLCVSRAFLVVIESS